MFKWTKMKKFFMTIGLTTTLLAAPLTTSVQALEMSTDEVFQLNEINEMVGAEASNVFNPVIEFEEPEYTTLNGTVTFTDFEDAADYESVNGEFYLYVSRTEDHKFTKTYLLDLKQDTSADKFTLVGDFSHYGDSETWYFVKVVFFDYDTQEYKDCTLTKEILTKKARVFNPVLEIEEPKDNMISGRVTTSDFVDVNDYNGYPLTWAVYISKTVDFEEPYMYILDLKHDETLDGYTIVADFSHTGDANTKYYVKVAVYDNINYKYLDYQISEVTTKAFGYKAVIDIKESEYKTIKGTVTITNFANEAEYESANGVFAVYVSETDDFKYHYTYILELKQDTSASGYTLVDDFVHQGDENKKYYVKVVFCGFDAYEEVECALAEVTTKAKRVFSPVLEVEEPEYSVVKIKVTFTDFVDADDYANENIFWQVYVSDNEDFRTPRYYTINPTQDTTAEGYTLTADLVHVGNPNTNYYVKVVGCDRRYYEYTHYAVTEVTTKEKRTTFNPILEIVESDNMTLNGTVTLTEFANDEDFYSSNMVFYVYVSETEDFAKKTQYNLSFQQNKVNQDVTFVSNFSFVAKSKTSYFVKVVSYNRETTEYINYPVTKVAIKDNVSIEPVLELKDVRYNDIEGTITINNYASAGEFADSPVGILYFSETQEVLTFEEILVEIENNPDNISIVEFQPTNQSNVFSGEFTYTGKAETTYYIHLLLVSGETVDDMAVYNIGSAITEPQRTVNPILEIKEPEYNLVEGTVKFVDFTDRDDFNSLNTTFYVYLSETEDFANKNQYSLSFSQDTAQSVYTLVADFVHDGKENTKYYVKVVAYNRASGSYTDFAVQEVTTKNNRVLHPIADVTASGTKINGTVTIKDYESATDYESEPLDMTLIYFSEGEVTISDENLEEVLSGSGIVEAYFSATNDAEYTLTADFSWTGKANTTYHMYMLNFYKSAESTYGIAVKQYDMGTVTTGDERTGNPVLAIDEVKYDKITGKVTLTGFTDRTDFNSSNMRYYAYVSETEDFASKNQYSLSFSQDKTQSGYTLVADFLHDGEENTKYYVKVVAYNSASGSYTDCVVQEVTTKNNRVLHPIADVTTSGTKINGTVTIKDYTSETDYKSEPLEAALIYFSEEEVAVSDENLEEVLSGSGIVEAYFSATSDAEYTLTADFTYTGKANTTYYMYMLNFYKSAESTYGIAIKQYSMGTVTISSDIKAGFGLGPNGIWAFYNADGTIDTTKNGLIEYDGAWFYLVNGVLDTATVGMNEYDGRLFYVANGQVVANAQGLVQDPTDGEWYYVADGQVVDYTGLALYDSAWFYVTEGKLDTTMAGFVEYDGALFYVGAGRYLIEAQGLVQDPTTNKWYFLGDGMVQKQYTGLAQYDNAWFYIINGELAESYVGTVEYDGAIFNVVAGKVV